MDDQNPFSPDYREPEQPSIFDALDREPKPAAAKSKPTGSIRYFPELIQGSDEWLAARRGLLTASEMSRILTPTLKIANNDKERAHVFELLAQRITGYVEPQYISDDMLRGQVDEMEARLIYSKHFAQVQEMGFITNVIEGVTIGYSPDGMVGDDGLIECKSRRQRFQVETVISFTGGHEIPAEFGLQVQTGLMVAERQWLDFVSYSGGLPMITIRVFPDPVVQAAIIEAAVKFEERLTERLAQYEAVLAGNPSLIPTIRKIYEEMHL